jgi:hypothetical protein
MKQSQVKVGTVAMLSLGGRRGSVRVVVRYQFRPERAGDVRWSCLREATGEHFVATPRQLRPLPRGYAFHPACDHDALERMLASDAALRAAKAEPGQTIDAGDVVITTTLHRLG